MSQMPDFLAAMLRDGAQEGEPQQPFYPLPEAQRDELGLMVAAYGCPPRPFQRGDFVSYKHGHGPLTVAAREKLALVFWRYLDLTDGTAGQDFRWIENLSGTESATASQIDCLIAYINTPTGTLTFQATDSHAIGLAPALQP